MANLTVNLPIECIAFTGMQKGLDVKLEWQTATETNNAGFEVLRSIDGEQFDAIGWVDGNGTTSETTTFSFTDKTAIPGREYYYRLNQRDFDGTKQFACDVVRVSTEGFDSSQISIAPNPAITKTTIFLPESLAGSTLHMSSADGKFIRTIPVASEKQEFLRNDLPSGLYFIKIENEHGFIADAIKLIFVDR